MDMFNATSSWLHHQQHSPEHQHVLHDTRSPSVSDWDKPSSSSAGPTGAAGSPPSVQSGFDLANEFVLGDPAAPSTSASISPPPQSFFGSHSFQQPYYLPPAPGPYNAMPYGQTPWTGQPSSSQVPLSNYSSLNGATTSSTASPSQQPQQQQSPPPQMIIDPALTTMNGSSSSGLNQQFSQSPPNYSAQSTQQQQQQQRTQYQYQQHMHPLSINPSYVQSSHYYPHQHQQQSQSQGTLSPQALHSASSSMMSSLLSPTFYASNPTPQGPSPQVRKEQFQASIRPLLQPASFTGAGAVNSLVLQIDEFGPQSVETPLRLEILTKIRDNAGNHYFRAWAENLTAIDITREWLKAAFTAKSDSPLVETIMPLLHIIDRLPLTLETLKSSKFGKIVVKLVKDPPTPAIKDMAFNVERRWRQMLQEGGSKQTELNATEDAKSKKRKPTEPPTSKAPPPAKKVAVTPSSSRTPLKKETKPTVTAVKDAKSDSSFFSAPKPKPKLPTFKKALVPVRKEPDLNIAQPSSIDPFQEALKSMAKTRKESPAISTPPPIPAASTPPVANGLTKTGKKRKSVTWASEDQLESVRFIEKAMYDDDPVDGIHTSHSLRDLDRDEGAALHAHLFEEVIDWSEPILVEIPIDIDMRPRGEDSQEKISQEEREQTALGALYMTLAQIPDSPGEPSNTIPEEEVDQEVRQMICGDEADSIFWSVGAPAPMQPPPVASVADLVSQLSAGAVDQSISSPMNGLKAFGLDPNLMPSVQAMQNLPTEHLQQIIQQAQALSQQYGQQGQSGVQPPYGGVDQSWSSNQYSEYGQGYDEGGVRDRRWGSESRGRGRARGRGRGRGDDGYRHSKRKPCSFFAAGRCKYGDQCDYSHEPI